LALKKELSFLDLFALTSGAIISSGLFILPGLAYAQAGPAILISYLIAGLLAATGMLSQAELVSAMPKAGGTYFYVTRSMGSAVGTVYGITTFLALSFKSAFELIGMAVFTKLIIDFDIRVIAFLLSLAFVLVNLKGIKEVGKIQVILFFCILTALLVFIVSGLPSVNIENFIPFTPHGTDSILFTSGFVFMSFGGLLKIASIAEEVKDPGRVLPLGMILSLIVVEIIYFLVIFIVIGVLNPNQLTSSLTPVSDGAAVFLGPFGKILLGIAAIFAFSTATNAGIMGASRYPFALSRDRLLPELFGRISEKFKTPHVAIVTTGLCMVAALFLKLDIIVKSTSCILILTYIFPCLAVIILRESRIQNYQPRFKTPFYPLIQVIGIVGLGILLFEIGIDAMFISLFLIAFGLFIYWFYGRIRSHREYALLHLIERITAKELTSYSLESELKEIITERDNIHKDRFDTIIENCLVLDLNQCMNMNHFFQLIVDKITERIKVEPETLYKLLIKREEETSTIISPGIAIPHIIIEGKHEFDIMLVRCKEGIIFSEECPPVHTVFTLIGTKDERNFHLRALAAIAQIVQEPHFEKNWLAARNERALKDIILLGKRIRRYNK